MATPEQVAQDFSGPAPSFVSAPDDFIARTLRSTASTFTPALQTTESLLGNTENAQRLADIRRDMATNQPGDLLPTNPELDNSVGATVANTIGSAAPRAALLGLTGGAGLPLLAAETLAANRTLVPEQQAQWDLASQAATTPEELAALGPRPTALSANTSGLGSLAAFALAGPALARLGTPLLANVTPALRPFAGVGLNTLTNVGADLGIQSAESAITGKPMEVTPNSLAASFTGGAIFGVHPGIEQAAGVPEFLRARAARQQLAQLQAEAKARANAQAEADKVAQAATPQTVTPATGAPDHVVIKTPTEDEPGVSVAPPRVVPPTNPTAELAKTNPDATLLPIAAKTVASSDTSEPKVIQTPKAEPVEEPKKTEEEPAPPPTDEQRLADISKQMREIEDSVLGDTSELDAQTKKKYNALSDEAYELRTGQKPEKNVAAPVTGNERPDLSKAPPPFTSEDIGQPAQAEVERPQGEKFGISRPVTPDQSLAILPEDEFQNQRSAATKSLDAIEKILDQKGIDGLSPSERNKLGQAQDRYGQFELENLRRKSAGQDPADLFDELLDKTDRIGDHPEQERGQEAYEEAKILADELRRQNVTQDVAGRNQLDSLLRGNANDKTEVLQSRMGRLRKFLGDAYGEPNEKITERRIAPKLSEDLTKLTDDQLAEAENKAKGNPEAQKLIDDEYDRRATLAANNGEAPEVRTGGPEGDTGVPAGPDVPEAERGGGVPGNEGEPRVGEPAAVPGLTAEESKELSDLNAEETALWNKPKLTDKEDRRIQEIQDRRDELEAKQAEATKSEPVVPDQHDIGVRVGNTAPEPPPNNLSKIDLDRANKHVLERLVNPALKIAGKIFGRDLTLHIEKTSGGGAEIGVDGNGGLHLIVDPNMGSTLRQRAKSAFGAGALAKKFLGEELVHVAQLVAPLRAWEAADPATRGRADEFVKEYARQIVGGILRKAINLRSKGEHADFAKLDEAVRAARSTYDQKPTTLTGEQLLRSWLARPDDSLKYMLELDRQLQQFASKKGAVGAPTEKIFFRAIDRLHDWAKQAFSSLKGAVGIADKQGFGPEFNSLYENTRKNLQAHDLKIREEPGLPKETLDSLNGLNVTYNGVQEGFGKAPSVNLFTSREPGAETTFAAPLGASAKDVEAARDRALLPYRERTRTETTEVPPTPETGAPTSGDNGNNGGQINPPAGGGGGVSGGSDTTPVAGTRIGATPIDLEREGEPELSGGRSGTTGTIGKNAGTKQATVGQSKTFLENAFDRIKNLPIIGRVFDRGTPEQRDFRDILQKKLQGKEAEANNSAIANRLAVRLAFGDQDKSAGYVALASGAGRIGDEPQRFEVVPSKDKDGKDTFDVRDNDGHVWEIAKTKEDAENWIKENPPLEPATKESVSADIQAEINKGRAALEDPNIPDDTKATIKKWLPTYEKALKNLDALIPGAKRSKEIYDQLHQIAVDAGADIGYRTDYAQRAYEQNKTRGGAPTPPEYLINGGRSGIQRFSNQRTYETLMDAMIGKRDSMGNWNSEKPKSLDLADLIANRTYATMDMAGQKAIENEFQTIQYPGTGEPVFIPKPTGDEPLPPNYVRVDGPLGTPLYVYGPAADLFKTIWGKDAVRASDVGHIALNTAAVLKHGSLALDTFHLARTEFKAAFDALANGGFKGVGDWFKNHPSYTEQGQMGKYLALTDLRPEDIPAALKAGIIRPEDAAYVNGQGKTTLRRMGDSGLLPGRFADNLWKQASPFLRGAADLVGKASEGAGKIAHAATDQLETFNKFTFDRLTRSAMIASFENRLARIDAQYPELTEYQRSRKAGQEVNEMFGNIGHSGIFKSPTMKSLSQIFMLAPNWVQSQVMNEARGYGQIAQSALDATYGKKLANGERERVARLGNSGRFLAQTALTMLAANQAINLATRGQFTWQNPEKDHKWDAWIPGGKDGFFYSPLALPAEYTHQIKNYSQYEGALGAVSHIASNKLSPLAQAAKVALTQKNYMGQKLTPGQTAGEVAKTLAPVPIIASSTAKGLSPAAKSGTFQQNILRSFGLPLDRAPDAVAQAYQAFQPYRKPGPQDTTPSPYKDLKTLVQNGADPADIKAEVARLNKEGHTTPNIQKSFTNTFHPSGSVKGDLQGLKEHPEFKAIYDKAKAQKEAEKNTFMKALQAK